MQSGEERLDPGCSKEVEMSWGSEDLRGNMAQCILHMAGAKLYSWRPL